MKQHVFAPLMGYSRRTISLCGSLLIAGLTAACGGDGSGTANVSNSAPEPVGNRAPILTGTPPARALEAENYEFQPSASDPDNDELLFSIVNKPSWTSFDRTTGRLSGVPAITDDAVWSDVRIGVSDGKSTAELEPFDIIVEFIPRGAVTLSWLAPYENIDKSPLVDLAGYNIYWGSDLTYLDNSVVIDNPNVTSHVIGDLVSGTYYFATTSFNQNLIESDLSEPATLVIP